MFKICRFHKSKYLTACALLTLAEFLYSICFFFLFSMKKLTKKLVQTIYILHCRIYSRHSFFALNFLFSNKNINMRKNKPQFLCLKCTKIETSEYYCLHCTQHTHFCIKRIYLFIINLNIQNEENMKKG